MEQIRLYCRPTAGRETVNLRFRITEGRRVSMYLRTGIKVTCEDLAAFTPAGDLRSGAGSANDELTAEIAGYKEKIRTAYGKMRRQGMNLCSEVLRAEVSKLMTASDSWPQSLPETMVERYRRYVEEAWRDGVIGKNRYVQCQSKVRRLHRFLSIAGVPGIPVRDFDTDLLLRYRRFVFDEYLYVSQYPSLYPTEGKRRQRWPVKRMHANSVANEMRALKAFLNEMEVAEEINRSPFRKLSNEKRRLVMRVRYDTPFFLRTDEFRTVLEAPLPPELEEIRDIFVLNCCLGCRIGDFLKLTMDRVAVSPEGIPYIHYFPSKTRNHADSNREIHTPLVRVAFDIVCRTRFRIGEGTDRTRAARYNRLLPDLLRRCGIDRKVSVFDGCLQDNVYKPLWEVASSRLARKTHVDMMNKVQINIYAAGLHARGSRAVYRYTSLELADRFALMNAAFGQESFAVDGDLRIVSR